MASLLTQCPHCQTSFRVSRSQLAVAEGQVRCGSCLGVFSARGNEIRVKQPPLLDQPLTPEELSALTTAASAAGHTAITLDGDDEVIEYADEDHAAARNESAAAGANLAVGELVSPDNVPLVSEPLVHEPTVHAIRVHDFRGPDFRGRELRQRDAAVRFEDEDEEPFRIEDDAARDALAAAGVDDFDDEFATLAAEPAPGRFWNSLLYGLMSLLLLGALAVQLLVVNFDDLSHNANPYFLLLRPYLIRPHALLGPFLTRPFVLRPYLCQVLPSCAPEPEAPPRLISEQLVVQARPEAPATLDVSAMLRNNGAATQPLPSVELIFRNAQNQIVASRVFTPEEYLKPEQRNTVGVPSRSAVQVQLALVNPGPEALHYEIVLHPPPRSAKR
jgi:predicted Zn finger-like uncharacterized protein